MKQFTPREEQEVLQSIRSAIKKACAEGQPVRKLAQAAAQGWMVKCRFVVGEDGGEQLLLWAEEE